MFMKIIFILLEVRDGVSHFEEGVTFFGKRGSILENKIIFILLRGSCF